MANRRVLVIAYYFPPSGGSGVQRTLKFVKYLPAFSWEPVVLTVDPEYAAYPDYDLEMMSEVPAEAEVHRTQSWDPYRIYAGLTRKSKDSAVSVGFLRQGPVTVQEKLSRWIRANLFIPDARVGWYFYARKQAETLVKNRNVDAIFTTGPPHSTHLIGRWLKRKFGLPWIADFRDPWIDIDFQAELPMTRGSRKLNAFLEQSVLDESSLVITVSPVMQRKFADKTNTRCETIFNGFDEADFSTPTDSRQDVFYLSHVGNMNGARNPQILWQILEEERGALPALRIRLVGNVDGQIMDELAKSGLTDIVDRIEYCTHSEAVRYMKDSAALLLPINRVSSAKGIVTGKLFEYLAAGHPIVGIGPVDGDAAQILDDTHAGKMLDFEDEKGLRLYLMSLYRTWENKEKARENGAVAAARYSREAQTGHLARLLDELVAEKTP